uniref:CYCLIN domain-containing protein n=1 Tax=Elaeophora elaphi TaxID=1147741 RepID=A0A0R3RXH3_9BILA
MYGGCMVERSVFIVKEPEPYISLIHFRSNWTIDIMYMHNRISKQSAYQLLLMQNSLLSMTKFSTPGNRKSEDNNDDNLCQNIHYNEEECQQSEGRCEAEKSDCCDRLVISDDTLLLKQVCQTDGINIGKSEGVNVRVNTTGAGETSFRSLRKLSKKNSFTTSVENKEKSEQNMKELTNRQKFLKLCNIKNQRYFLVSDESEMPVVAFSHLPYNRERLTRSYSQSEDPDRLGITSFAQAKIKPINYKYVQEVSFRDLISTNGGSISYSSEGTSLFHKHSAIADKSSNVIYPHISTRWHISTCDRIIGIDDLLRPQHTASKLSDTVEEGALLLHPTACNSSSNINSTEYDPNLIANFDCHTRKTVMKFNEYVSIIMHYQPENEVKRLVNEAFRSRFPHVHRNDDSDSREFNTLIFINFIKRELHQIAVACNLEDTTTAHAYVFYEKALLKGLVYKMNRKLVAGAALLIAAKITDFGSMCISDVVNSLESSLRINRKELLRYEIPLCAALSFNLRIPVWQLLPHYQRIALTIL